ncbi:MAG: hypothetical protein LBJ00_18035 [Planctomycetaceae bacterium]|nr:hypothetical protein [Planctomycetaceae bacterium]
MQCSRIVAAPDCANRRATAPPIPPDAPVISTVLPSKPVIGYTQAVLKFPKLNTQAQQREAIAQGLSLSPYQLR